MKSTGKLISRKRISHLPSSTVFAHEYCFFLHDQIVQMLSDYERAKAHHVGFKFLDNKEAKRFHEIAAETNTIYAMRQFGFNVEAKKVIINQITMGLVSDSLHHIFEALRCFEKRKVIVAFNLLRV